MQCRGPAPPLNVRRLPSLVHVCVMGNSSEVDHSALSVIRPVDEHRRDKRRFVSPAVSLDPAVMEHPGQMCAQKVSTNQPAYATVVAIGQTMKHRQHMLTRVETVRP